MSKMPENASGKSFPAAQFSGVLDYRYGQTGTLKKPAQGTIGDPMTEAVPSSEAVAQYTGSIGNISSSSNRNINCSIINTSNSNINIKSSNSGFINSNIINTTNISSNSYSSSLILQTGSELHQGGTNLQQEVGAFF